MQTLAEGWWCTQCEFFEQEDEIDTTIDECPSCGCNGSEHVPVEITNKEINSIIKIPDEELSYEQQAMRDSDSDVFPNEGYNS